MTHKNLLIIPVLLAAITAPQFVSARENVGIKKGTPPPVIRAACTSPTIASDLAVNNVRCRILLSDMWWNLSSGQYEIPKGGGVHSMFAGALWIGGIDAGGQIKVAAQTYRQTGTDFWPGPLNTSDASVNSEVCVKYDRHYRITRQEVEAFVAGGAATPAITDWPGNGDVSLGQDQQLAPFFDKNADGIYSPSNGDYPGYDLVAGDGYGECITVNCTPVDQLFGDETIWWVFNDNGNVHGESKGQPIGLEIRAQAFGFATDDEINNMTFYNYRVFNRSTFQVDSCYFGVWADPDLGDYSDDFVGCDVGRGLGYTYNGDNDDDASAGGYGLNPPAIGVDYFRGPIADANDGKDNDRNCLTDEPCEQNIMSGFMFYNNANNVPNGNPGNATHFYNYLKMKWGDNTPVKFGGDGFGPTATGPACNFMFPGNPTTDLHNWGSAATVATCSTTPTLGDWDEVLAGNTPDDRRMLLSAGPFKLLPGAVNVVTTGVVWARATSGGAQASVQLLQAADDKAQALFDNCFKVLDGPDAPDVTVQELDKEIILYLSYASPTSNNYKERYNEFDPLIALLDTANNPVPDIDTTYNFQGYKIYQVKDPTVTGADVDNANKARLVAQSDRKDGISKITNYEFDQVIGASVPRPKVAGADLGVSHSIRITTDAFSSGSPALVNHKTYYFLAIAYGHNEFKKYLPDTPPGPDPFAPASNGQKKPYKQGRKNIKVYSAIPHSIAPYNGGNEAHSVYGSMPAITRVEGNGNGGNTLELTSASIDAILNSSDNLSRTLTYEAGMGPITVKVIDPLNVPEGHNFTLKFDSEDVSNSTWRLRNNTTGEEIQSDTTIKILNEQLFMNWGLAVSILQPTEPGNAATINNGYLTSSITFADPSKKWLSGLVDTDAPSYENWIRSGTTLGSRFTRDYIGVDDNQYYEKVVDGSWAPYRLVAHTDPAGSAPNAFNPAAFYTGAGHKSATMSRTLMSSLASVNVVFTSDKSKWTRCVVLELCEDSLWSANTAGSPRKARKMDYRRALSVDKNGSTAIGSDNNDFATGMGWFPGYAINVETGERLNIAFGENSALVNENGNDMKWNPTSNKYDPAPYNLPWDTTGQTSGSPVFGGQHYIYVFGHNKHSDFGTPAPVDTMTIPRYDKGKRMREMLGWDNGQPVDAKIRDVFRDAMWVTIPLLASGRQLLETDVTVKLRVVKPYKKAYSPAFWVDGVTPAVTHYFDTTNTPQNRNLPMYTFNTQGLSAHTNHEELAVEALDLINVVPNPYYAYSDYEKSSLDNAIKITNLPEVCTVSIYNLGGTLIRKMKKGEDMKTHSALNTEVTYDGGSVVIHTWDGSLNWDLKNTAGVPISSGVYVIHVEVPEVGERVIKWFGIMRPVELDAF